MSQILATTILAILYVTAVFLVVGYEFVFQIETIMIYANHNSRLILDILSYVLPVIYLYEIFLAVYFGFLFNYMI